jgi:hypothetical protein
VSTTAAAEAESSVMLMKPGPATSTLDLMPSALVEFGGEQFGEIARLHAGLLGQLHGRCWTPSRHARGPSGASRRAWPDGRNQLGGQGACLAFGDEGVGNAENQFT